MCQVLRSQLPPQSLACHRGESSGIYVVSIHSLPSQKWTGECYEPSALAFEYGLDTPPAIPVQIRNLHLETLPSSIRTVFTMHLITANATSTRVLAPTVSSSYGVDFFPQPTINPSHVGPSQHWSSFICKTSRAKSLVTTSIRLWRS